MTVFALLSGLGHTVLVMAGLLVYVLATRIGHQRRNPSAAVAWVIAMVTLPYLTLPLFLLIGTRKVAAASKDDSSGFSAMISAALVAVVRRMPCISMIWLA